MKVYVVTVQGQYIDVYLSEEDAESHKYSLYMAGHNGISITPKELK